jgi:hypothetical protein
LAPCPCTSVELHYMPQDILGYVVVILVIYFFIFHFGPMPLTCYLSKYFISVPCPSCVIYLNKYQNFKYKISLSLTGFRLWRQYWRQYWGYIFFGGILPSKMGRFAPFLATIQALSKTCAFLLNKRSKGCIVSDAPPLVLAPTIFIIALFS